MAEDCNIKVCVRARPLNKRELKKKESQCVIDMYKNATIITHPHTLHLPEDQQQKQIFAFDDSFWSVSEENSKNIASQSEIYERIGAPILKNLIDGYNGCILSYGQTGCLDPDTEILMFDGSVKKAKEIQVGDVLMGDDSTPRNVMDLFSGKSKMYNVISKYGTTYKVNQDHVLTLTYKSHPTCTWDEEHGCYIVAWNQKQKTKYFSLYPKNSPIKGKSFEELKDAAHNRAQHFCNSLSLGDKIFDIPIGEYLKKPIPWKKAHKGVHVGVEFPELDLAFDPYMLGLWLSHGELRLSQFYITYTEVLNQVRKYFPQANIVEMDRKYFYEVVYFNEEDEKEVTFHHDVLNCFLLDYDLLDNKHIPKCFLINSRANRLKLLAGLIDGNSFTTTDEHILAIPNNLKLVQDVMFLARSLGFRCVMKETSIGYDMIYKCFITGSDIDDIPLLVKSKRIINTDISHHYEQTSIEVVSADRGEYNGFCIDANQRFLLADFTVTHNSGKTYSMIGGNSEQTKGIIPRICCELFEYIKKADESKMKYQVELSYLEIYAEQIRDLIFPENNKNLKVREHPDTGPYVEELTIVPVENYYSVNQFIMFGNKFRHTAATKMNDHSSRSHAVFIIYLTQIDSITQENLFKSKLCLVDLAGSEKQKDSGVTGVNLKEAININTSLTMMGRVINALAKNSTEKSSIHIPFRDSVLTWLLKDSLGGNSKTVMLAAISPSSVNYEETLNTLQYASRAKQIVNKVSINSSRNDLIVAKLKTELVSLEEQWNILKQTKFNEINQDDLKQQILQRQKLLNELSANWEQRLIESQKLQMKTIEKYKTHMKTIRTNLQLPFFINISPSLNFDEELIHYIPIGTHKGTKIHELFNCMIEHNESGVYIIPHDNEISVNDVTLHEKQMLDHGDRIKVDENIYFKFKIPIFAIK